MRALFILVDAALLIVAIMIFALPEARTPPMHWLVIGLYVIAVAPLLVQLGQNTGLLRMSLPQTFTAYRQGNRAMPVVTGLSGVASFAGFAATWMS